jgi:hypothetical protein
MKVDIGMRIQRVDCKGAPEPGVRPRRIAHQRVCGANADSGISRRGQQASEGVQPEKSLVHAISREQHLPHGVERFARLQNLRRVPGECRAKTSDR